MRVEAWLDQGHWTHGGRITCHPATRPSQCIGDDVDGDNDDDGDNDTDGDDESWGRITRYQAIATVVHIIDEISLRIAMDSRRL